MTQLIALTERHYSVKELAQMWGLSATAIRRLFRDEPGVLRFGKEKRGHQRDYVTLRIPASVAERVYRRCARPGLVPSGDQDKMKAVR
jgi:AraC-like DNA-binding protein